MISPLAYSKHILTRGKVVNNYHTVGSVIHSSDITGTAKLLYRFEAIDHRLTL
jgi:hypothetical protein